jgi:hypothetical protein
MPVTPQVGQNSAKAVSQAALLFAKDYSRQKGSSIIALMGISGRELGFKIEDEAVGGFLIITFSHN